MKEDMKMESKAGMLPDGSVMCGPACYCRLEGYELYIHGHGEIDVLYDFKGGYLTRSQEWQCRQDHRPWQKCAAYLKKIVIDEGITRIDRMAFRGFHSLEEVVIPSTVKTIGAGAFMNCDLLKTVVLPEGVEAIEAYAFANCYWMKSFYAPESLRNIGQYAFNGCVSLRTLEISPFADLEGLGVLAGRIKIKEGATKSLWDVVY